MSFKIVTLPEKALVGMKVATSMEKASQDCPNLWMTFGPRVRTDLAPLGILSPSGESYGISIMTTETDFDYWVTAEIKQNTTKDSLPSDMAQTTLAGGSYVCCDVKSLAELGNAYTALYMEWPGTQNEYDLDMSGASFELYPANWSPEATFSIYAPVKKRG